MIILIILFFIYGMGVVYYLKCNWSNLKIKFSSNKTLEKQVCELKKR